MGLSIKAKEHAEEKEAIQEMRDKSSEQVAPTTIGDLIKAQMEK